MTTKTLTPEEIETETDAVRAVDTWESCDVAALVPDGGDIGPVRRGREVVEIVNCKAAPYHLIRLNDR